MVAAFERMPWTMTGILLDHVHGAATRVDATATAFPHRQEAHSVLVLAQWMNPGRHRVEHRLGPETFEMLRLHLSDGRYTNFMSRRRLRAPGIWRELRASRAGQTRRRPRQLLPPQPQHRARRLMPATHPAELSHGSFKSKNSGSPMLSASISSIWALSSAGGSLRSPSRAACSDVKYNATV
jgi:hypothetical protein